MVKECIAKFNIDKYKADEIARVASKFKCDLSIMVMSKKINCKSVLGIISLAIKKGDKFLLVGNGLDEQDALSTLLKLL